MRISGNHFPHLRQYLIFNLNFINFSLAYAHASTFIEEIKEGLSSCDFDNYVKKWTSFDRLTTFYTSINQLKRSLEYIII